MTPVDLSTKCLVCEEPFEFGMAIQPRPNGQWIHLRCRDSFDRTVAAKLDAWQDVEDGNRAIKKGIA